MIAWAREVFYGWPWLLIGRIPWRHAIPVACTPSAGLYRMEPLIRRGKPCRRPVLSA